MFNKILISEIFPPLNITESKFFKEGSVSYNSKRIRKCIILKLRVKKTILYQYYGLHSN